MTLQFINITYFKPSNIDDTLIVAFLHSAGLVQIKLAQLSNHSNSTTMCILMTALLESIY